MPLSDRTEPLIFTSKGSLPESSLRLEPVWTDTADFTKLTLSYYLGDEIVKESAHVLSKQVAMAATLDGETPKAALYLASGTVTLAGAVAGYHTFASGFGASVAPQ